MLPRGGGNIGASYADVSRAVHTLTHNVRLLSGKSTSNIGVVIQERRSEIDRLIDARIQVASALLDEATKG
jgi:hypothetical protein